MRYTVGEELSVSGEKPSAGMLERMRGQLLASLEDSVAWFYAEMPAYYFTITDPGGVTGTNPRDVQATTNLCKTYPGTPTASSTLCSQATVSSPFTGDSNGNGTAAFKRGTAPAGPFATTVCASVAGASPRTCPDTTTVESSLYYYQVTFSDPDGVGGTNNQVAMVTTPACPPVLALSNPGVAGQPAAANVTAGSSTNVGKFTLTANKGSVSITALSIGNLGSTLPGVDVLRLQLFDDFSGAARRRPAASSRGWRRPGK